MNTHLSLTPVWFEAEHAVLGLAGKWLRVIDPGGRVLDTVVKIAFDDPSARKYCSVMISSLGHKDAAWREWSRFLTMAGMARMQPTQAHPADMELVLAEGKL